MNLPIRLQQSCRAKGNTVAINYESEQLTYTQLWLRILGVAKELRQLGIKPQERIALLMENSAEFIISYFAILATGATVVPIETMAVPREILFVLQNANISRLITSSLFQQIADTIKTQIPNLVIISPSKSIATEQEYLVPEIDETDVAVIIYTSGTTGNPKGAQLTHRNLLANTESCIQVIQSTENDKFLCILPLFHSFAATVCMLTPLLSGATVVPMKVFRPDLALKLMEKEKITVLAAVPSMYLALAKAEPNTAFDLSRIKYCISGGAGLPLKVMELFESRFKIPIYEGYGLSEASPVVSLNPLGGKRKPGSIGLPIPGVKMRVVDDNLNDKPIREIGEIAVQGDNVMLGYLGLPEITEQTIRNNWLLTGDLGYQDEDGYFYIVDRKKEMILVRGLNVYPREVENVLYSHPEVLEAAVIPVQDERSGEVPKAVVVLKTPGAVSESDLIAFCRDKLSAYKVPKYIEFRESLPKTSSGKILKRALV
ncbi:MAG: long-chain fatty acid--CoA ligase [bacterium]|nr:long-chain fatty acid--CoA ligase [bacterium]